MTPVVENDFAQTSYHGYACTDSYKSTRGWHFDEYKKLAGKRTGVDRVVHDWVPNHWGSEHRLTHPVDSAWHNWSGGFDETKRTNYRSGVVIDPHRQRADEAAFNDAGF